MAQTPIQIRASHRSCRECSNVNHSVLARSCSPDGDNTSPRRQSATVGSAPCSHPRRNVTGNPSTVSSTGRRNPAAGGQRSSPGISPDSNVAHEAINNNNLQSNDRMPPNLARISHQSRRRVVPNRAQARKKLAEVALWSR